MPLNGKMARTTSWTLLAIYACNSQATASLPDAEVAGSRTNAVHIFNSVHSAMRQWGSSLHHNGFSFFPVTVPAGNLFYHGRLSAERPVGTEWLAFEPEHAMYFTDSFLGDRWPNIPSNHSLLRRDVQHPLGHGMAGDGNDDHDPQPERTKRPYLHTYRATRDLNLVYIDGHSAGKAMPPMGTQDSQDYLLLDHAVEDDPLIGPWSDTQRAKELCELAASWGGVDGWIRNEAGFEMIVCDFAPGNGLDLAHLAGIGFPNETGVLIPPFEDWVQAHSRHYIISWARAAAARYNGFPPGRALVDFSGMVSALAYTGVNSTNPNSTRAELPRLVSTPPTVLHGIRDRLRDVMSARRGRVARSANWQAATDNIIKRYARHIQKLALQTTTPSEMREELRALLGLFLDYPAGVSPGSHDRCYQHYIGQVQMPEHGWTLEDLSIKAALMTVQRLVCDTLFETHKLLKSANSHDDKAAAEVRASAQALMEELRWTTWKECSGCDPVSEVCMVPMFTMGDWEDYEAPSCKNSSQIGWAYWWKSLPWDR